MPKRLPVGWRVTARNLTSAKCAGWRNAPSQGDVKPGVSSIKEELANLLPRLKRIREGVDPLHLSNSDSFSKRSRREQGVRMMLTHY